MLSLINKCNNINKGENHQMEEIKDKIRINVHKLFKITMSEIKRIHLKIKDSYLIQIIKDLKLP